MSEKYDVVIIGAGIGGLVCGCYLAKAGLKTLIVEQHNKPGGYCTSFERDGFRFDVGVHYLGGIKKGILGNILEELEIKEKIKFNQFDPTDKIIMPNKITSIRSNPYETVEELRRKFPKERKGIDDFFKLTMQEGLIGMYKRIGKLTFKELLDSLFRDHGLKSTLGILLYNIALSPQKASALASLILYKEFIFDPGYYPEGGMGNLSLAITNRFRELGGNLLLSQKVNEIIVRDNKVKGISFDSKEKVDCDFIVSNADATETFRELIRVRTNELTIVNKLVPTYSLFVLYMGLDRKIKREDYSNIWVSKTYDIDNRFCNLTKDIKMGRFYFYMVSFPSEHDNTIRSKNGMVAQAYLIVPYISRKFWIDNKDRFADKVIKEIERMRLFKENDIKIKLTATPPTFQRFTLNRKGSAFGWESTIRQLDPAIFPQVTSVKGLFLAGHWCMVGSGQGGIPKVAFSGKRASELILNKIIK